MEAVEAVAKIRNPKLEIRNNFECPKPNTQNAPAHERCIFVDWKVHRRDAEDAEQTDLTPPLRGPIRNLCVLGVSAVSPSCVLRISRGELDHIVNIVVARKT
jgi:hypothetical protein